MIRGEECQNFNGGMGSAKASCLKASSSETWFKAYTMKSPTLSYSIDVTFSVPTAIGTRSVETLKINSGAAQVLSPSGNGKIELVGEL